MKQKRIAFFLYEIRKLDTFHELISAIKILAEQGFHTDIFITIPMESDIKLPDTDIYCSGHYNPHRYVKYTLKKIREKGLKYDLSVAFFFEPLMVAEKLKREQGTPIIYYSLELFYLDYGKKLFDKIFNPTNILRAIPGLAGTFIRWMQLSSDNRITTFFRKHTYDYDLLLSYLKGILFYRRIQKDSEGLVSFSIIQDEIRGAALKKEFNFVDKIMYLPPTKIGFDGNKSEFAFEKFNIDKNKKIILFIGGIERGFDLKILDIAEKLDDDYVLLLNVYSRDGYIDEITKSGKYSKIQKSGKLIINKELLNDEEYTELVKSVYIGLGWYGKTDVGNIYYLGYASGKIMKYLSCGKPVIVPSYLYRTKELYEDTGLGMVCENTSDIPDRIVKISNSYEKYAEEIRSFYLENLEFKKQFSPICEQIMTLTEQQTA